MFVCETDNFVFPWTFNHFPLEATIAFTYAKDNQRKIILQKTADSANVELNDLRLRYTENSIVLRNTVQEDEGLYSFHSQPSDVTFWELWLRIVPVQGKAVLQR